MTATTAPAPPGPPRRRRPPQALRRTAQHGLVLTASTLCVLLACTVLTALAALVGTSVDTAAGDRLGADPDARVQASARYRATGLAEADASVRPALAAAFGEVRRQTSLSLLGEPPLAPAADASGLALHPVAVQHAAAHARLLSGRWPAGAGDPTVRQLVAPTSGTAPMVVETAVSRWTADRLRARPGSVLRLRDAQGRTAELRISGVFQPTGAAAFWAGAAGNTDGAQQLLVVSPADLLRLPVTAGNVLVHWTAVPLAPLSVARLPALARRVDALVSGPGIAVGDGFGRVTATSALGQAATSAVGPAAASRSGLLLPTALLACLAATAVLLTSRQLAGHWQAELALRLVRGAGTGRLLGQAAGEWAMTAVPAGVAAWLLAGPLLAALHRLGLVGITVPGGELGGAARVAVPGTLLVYGLAALLPVVWALTGRWAGSRLRPRGPRAAAAQRLGADLALLVLAGLGFARLAQHRTTTLTTAGGGTAVDPVLVLLPAAATVATSLLLLRLLPLASRLLDRFGQRRTDLVLPLAGWQLARRASRVAEPVLLVCLAVSVGALSTTALGGLDGLARDQARFQVGADVLVDSSGSAVEPAALRERYLALPGVTGATPVTRTLADTPSGDLVELVGSDTTPVGAGREGATAVPTLRADLAGRDFHDRLVSLARGIPAHGLPLPGRPTALWLDETLTSDGERAAPLLRLTLEDASGLTSTLTTALPPADGARHLLEIPLPGGGGLPSALTRLTLLPQGSRPAAQLSLALHRVGTPQGWAVTPPQTNWAGRTAQSADDHGTTCQATGADGGDPGVCALGPAAATGQADLLDLRLSTGPAGGTARSDAQVRLSLTGAPGGAVPALADAAALAAHHTAVGATLLCTLDDGTPLPVHIVGSVTAIPSGSREQAHLLVDQRQLAAALAAAGAVQQAPESWWLSSRDPAATAAAVAADPRLGTALTTAQAAAALRADPFKRGMRAVLTLCMLLAPGFAVVGFTVHAAISTRGRRREFALLRAIGVRARTLSTLLWTEMLGVALFAGVPGALLGTALATAVLPLVTTDDTGQPAFPALRLQVPWAGVALNALATTAVILLVVVVLARLLARVDLARVLRAGEQVEEQG